MIFDAHSDLLSALAQAYQQGGKQIFCRQYLPAFQKGQTTGGIFVLWANPDGKQTGQQQIQAQLQALQTELAEPAPVLRLAVSRKDLTEAEQQGQIAVVLGVEGLDSYPERADLIDVLYQQGVRHIGLTWNRQNSFASGTWAEGGLTSAGRSVLRQIQQYAMLLDIAHLNDTSLAEVLRLVDGPLLASHCNSRKLCSHRRNLTDDQIKAIAACGGVIGINSYPPFIAERTEQQDLQHMLDHLVHMAYLVGTASIGFGFDFNYWDTSEQAVKLPELSDQSQTAKLPLLLKERGFSNAEVKQICGGNFLRLLGRTLA